MTGLGVVPARESERVMRIVPGGTVTVLPPKYGPDDFCAGRWYVTKVDPTAEGLIVYASRQQVWRREGGVWEGKDEVAFHECRIDLREQPS